MASPLSTYEVLVLGTVSRQLDLVANGRDLTPAEFDDMSRAIAGIYYSQTGELPNKEAA
jgi:hypothetical protein